MPSNTRWRGGPMATASLGVEALTCRWMGQEKGEVP